MANVYSIVFTVVGLIGMHSCLLVWTALLVPRAVDATRERLDKRPLASLFLGLFCCLLTAAIIGACLPLRMRNIDKVNDLLQFLSQSLLFSRFYNDAFIITSGLLWLLAVPIVAGLIVGGAGFAQLFAVRARVLMREDRPLVGLAWGAFCTSAAYFLPVAGWFVFLPVVGLMSVGAGIWGIVARRPARHPSL